MEEFTIWNALYVVSIVFGVIVLASGVHFFFTGGINDR